MFLVADLIQRTAVTAALKLFPRSRERILVGWALFLREMFFGIVRGAGGAQFDIGVTIPCRAGELIVLNHQSLLDIPVVYATIPEGYPRIVTRARYGKGVPLISHMLRMYRHLLVTPGRDLDIQAEKVNTFVRECEHPVVIFPEGHRTRDGELLRWKKGGLRVALRARKWRVHVLTLDGLWQSLSIAEFMRHISSVRCRVVEADSFDFDPERDDVDAVIDRMEASMRAGLQEMRGNPAPPQEETETFGAQPDIAK